MTDVHSREVRHKNMAAIRAKDTRPEKLVRRALHAAGFRFRLHVKRLPGRPDIALARHHAVVLVHGCFFHGHDCSYFRWPKKRAAFWRTKIVDNRRRDARVLRELRAEDWRVLTVWECSLRGGTKRQSTTLAVVIKWLRSRSREREIREPRPR